VFNAWLPPAGGGAAPARQRVAGIVPSRELSRGCGLLTGSLQPSEGTGAVQLLLPWRYASTSSRSAA